MLVFEKPTGEIIPFSAICETTASGVEILQAFPLASSFL
jgi:hypothetical protein